MVMLHRITFSPSEMVAEPSLGRVVAVCPIKVTLGMEGNQCVAESSLNPQ